MPRPSVVIRTAWKRTAAAAAGVLPYVAELGSVAFVAAGLFAVIAAAAEFLQPGFVVNFISPRSIVAAVIISGALALVAPARPAGRRRRAVRVAVAALAAVLVFWAAWYYFQSVPDMRLKLSLAAALTVLAVIWLGCRRPADAA